MTDISVLLTVRDWDLTRVDMCLRSLRLNGGVSSEIVLIDYGSADPSGIRELAETHNCTFERVEATEWSRSNAMNTAAALARGRNIIFADADLVFAPTVLSESVSRLDTFPNSILMFQFRDLPPTIKPSMLLENPDFRELESEAVWRPRWGMGVQAYSRVAFESVRGFDDRMKIYGGEDNDIAKRARAHGYRLEWVNGSEFGLYHVWHPSSRTIADSSPETKAELQKNVDIAKNDKSIIRNLQTWRSDGPLVSVVITTFNRAEYIGASIESVLAQTVQEFEIIILSDGSTDNTSEVVESFRDPRIRFIDCPKTGIPGLRNKALDISAGKYTAIHDDDDLMVPWSLEVRLKALTAGVTGSYGGAYDFNNTTGHMSLFPGRPSGHSAVLNGAKVFYHATLLIETDVLRAVRYDEAFQSGSDFNLALRLTKSGVNLAHCGDIVLLRRLHDRQVTVTDQAVQHGASYVSTFAHRAAWGAGSRSKSREVSKGAPHWQYSVDVLNESRFYPYLPDHLVDRSLIILADDPGSFSGLTATGEVLCGDDVRPAVFIPRATISDLDRLRDAIANGTAWLFVSRASAMYSNVDLLAGAAGSIAPGSKWVVINPHLMGEGFVIVADSGSERGQERALAVKARTVILALGPGRTSREFIESAFPAGPSQPVQQPLTVV